MTRAMPMRASTAATTSMSSVLAPVTSTSPPVTPATTAQLPASMYRRYEVVKPAWPARPWLFPRAEQASHGHELADMVRVVIDDEQQLAQVGLARSVWNLRKWINTRIVCQLLQRLAVAAERSDAFVPRG